MGKLKIFEIMKTKIFILCFLFFAFIGYSQVATKIVTVDLSKPHNKTIQVCEDSLCKIIDSSKWLSVKSKDLVAIKLINGNPFKYTYKIDTKNISFFNEKVEVEKSVEKARAAADTISRNKSGFTAAKIILEKNQEVYQSIDSLNTEVKEFYETLKRKKTFDKADYTKRKQLRDKAEKHLTKVLELLDDLGDQQKDSFNSITKQSLLNTKEKAVKSIESIIQKLYAVDLDNYTLPIDVQGKNIDILEFKLRRFDRETKEEDLSFAPTPYNIWIRGGLKIDVSAGLFFTSLYDSEFDKKDDPTIAGNKIITLKNGGDYDLAFGSTINTYMRMNSWVTPTLNFGAVITKNEKLQVLLGGGLILGKQERIIFSAGLSMGKVDRIADSYQVGGSYNLGDSGDVPTQSQFKFGHYFGITYNLSKVKKISADKGIEQN